MNYDLVNRAILMRLRFQHYVSSNDQSNTWIFKEAILIKHLKTTN